MYIHKFVYESLPYCYIAAGIVIYVIGAAFPSAFLMAFIKSPLIYLPSALLYAAGAWVWVARSAYRRKSSKLRVENRKGLFQFPEGLYEYLPFIYLALGVIFISQVSGVYGGIAGSVLCLTGVLVWMIRAIYRSHDPVRHP
ncbi:MAG: hypothetical protein ACJAWL_001597 [Motiliproteus sp.]